MLRWKRDSSNWLVIYRSTIYRLDCAIGILLLFIQISQTGETQHGVLADREKEKENYFQMNDENALIYNSS